MPLCVLVHSPHPAHLALSEQIPPSLTVPPLYLEHRSLKVLFHVCMVIVCWRLFLQLWGGFWKNRVIAGWSFCLFILCRCSSPCHMNKEVIQRTHVYFQVQHSAWEGNRKKTLLSENILQFTLIRTDTGCTFSEPTPGCCQFWVS